MDRARYLVDAVVVEGRGVREVARSNGVSKSWLSELVGRFRSGGYEAVAARSKRPHRSPQRIEETLEDEIVGLRKGLSEIGLDAGPRTIAWHLERRGLRLPAESTISRVLVRRGFVTPQPRKRPRSSYLRFEAALPNECWQSDITHWRLATEQEVSILNFLDDHSRLCLASVVRAHTRANDVVATFHSAAATWGYPASLLTDNGAVYNAKSRLGQTLLEAELDRLGIVYKHSRPYHPQTCGKVERFHQTLKKFLSQQRPVRTVSGLQAQIDRFVSFYNLERPHKARDRMTPLEAFRIRDRAEPGTPLSTTHYRVRTDRIDDSGSVSLRYDSKMFHIGIGRRFKRMPVRLYIADLDVRVVTIDGELLRHLEIDPSQRYQGLGREVD